MKAILTCLLFVIFFMDKARPSSDHKTFEQIFAAMEPAFRAAQSSSSQETRDKLFFVSVSLASSLPDEFPEIPKSQYGKIFWKENGATHYDPNFVYDLIDDKKTPDNHPSISELPLPTNEELKKLSSFMLNSEKLSKIRNHELSITSLESLVSLITNTKTSIDSHLLSSRIIAFTYAIHSSLCDKFEQIQKKLLNPLDQVNKLYNIYEIYELEIQDYLAIAQKIWLSYACIHNCFKTNMFEYNQCGIAVKKRQRLIIDEDGKSQNHVFTYSEHERGLWDQRIYTGTEIGELYCHLGYIIKNNKIICFPVSDDACCNSSYYSIYMDVPYAFGMNNHHLMRYILHMDKIKPYTGWILTKINDTKFTLSAQYNGYEHLGSYEFDSARIEDKSDVKNCEIPLLEIWEQFCSIHPKIKTKSWFSNQCYIIEQIEQTVNIIHLLDMERIISLRQEKESASAQLELEILTESYSEILKEKTPEEYKTELEEKLIQKEKEEYQKKIEDCWAKRKEDLLRASAEPKKGTQTPKKQKITPKKEKEEKDKIERDIRHFFLKDLKSKGTTMRAYLNTFNKTAETLGIKTSIFGGNSHFSIKLSTGGKRIPIWHPHGKRSDEASLYLQHKEIKETMIAALIQGASSR